MGVSWQKPENPNTLCSRALEDANIKPPHGSSQNGVSQGTLGIYGKSKEILGVPLRNEARAISRNSHIPDAP